MKGIRAKETLDGFVVLVEAARSWALEDAPQHLDEVLSGGHEPAAAPFGGLPLVRGHVDLLIAMDGRLAPVTIQYRQRAPWFLSIAQPCAGHVEGLVQPHLVNVSQRLSLQLLQQEAQKDVVGVGVVHGILVVLREVRLVLTGVWHVVGLHLGDERDDLFWLPPAIDVGEEGLVEVGRIPVVRESRLVVEEHLDSDLVGVVRAVYLM
mmetsp:Transcript_17340/g.41676  ORF Transcript_17340/g.41676 Transcript_17340/m.41676 type:complete len:207 (-) Transcript_17340:709-1329(-)